MHRILKYERAVRKLFCFYPAMEARMRRQDREEVLSKMNTTNIQNIETFFNTSPGNREINM